MAGGAAQREGVFIVNFTAQDAFAPLAMLGCRAFLRPGREREARRKRLRLQRLASHAFDRDTKQDEVDVRIDRRPVSPNALQNKRAERFWVLAKGVERFDRREEGLM
jgi:hypothetical protein